jgi:hypothetical protein
MAERMSLLIGRRVPCADCGRSTIPIASRMVNGAPLVICTRCLERLIGTPNGTPTLETARDTIPTERSDQP